MSPTLVKQIKKGIERLDKLDEGIHNLKDFFWQIVYIPPKKKELNEDDVLRILEESRKEYREGKTKVLKSLKDLR